MEKEFAPYELAVKLKDLGFNEPCFGFYLEDGTWTPASYSRKGIVYPSNTDLLPGWYTALLFQQAFRWIREKYNIQGYIYSSTVRGNSEKTKQFTGYIWNINGIDMPFLSTDARDELHDTYEEAEVACLNKLIEIIENQKQK